MSETEQAELASITAQLQGEIARQGGEIARHAADPAAEGDSGALALLARLRELERVNSHLPIGWPVMPKGLVAKAVVYAQKIARRLLRWYIVPLVEQQNAYNRALADAVAWLTARRDEQERALAQLAAQAGHQGRDVAALAEQLRDQQRQLAAQARDLAVQAGGGEAERESQRLRLQRLELRLAATQPVQPQAAPGAPDEPDAFLLGLRFRSPAQVEALLHDYDDLFAAHLAPNADGSAPRALDIGCGRGELAAHLAALGYAALGVDLDADAIAAGQAAGRPVALGDALAHLASVAEGSLAVIVALQVVEHLTPGQTMRLLRACQRALRPGGLLVLETINPTCLHALVNWFLIDPSHQRPVHPETLRLLLEQAEFTGIGLRYLHPVPAEQALAPLPAAAQASLGEAASITLEGDIARLNHLLFGAQDYAAIALKPTEMEARP
jgi:SAM-dependent methyltransferase